MLTSAFMLLISSTLIMLRLGKSEGSFPKPLSAQEERKYVDMWLAGDIEARNVLIEHNLRLVAHIVKKYYTQCTDADDLISIGTIGLIKGVSSYDPEKGVRLATYASKCIENEVLMYFRGAKKSSGDISLSDTIDTDGDGGSLCLMDVVCLEDDMVEKVSRIELRRKLGELVESSLDDREKKIIRLRYGMDGNVPGTQREVAEICKISRSYVSRIEKKALEKLRIAYEEKYM